ncbi:hypothetical protein [Gluconacetobacter tumulicola]|uniref:Uncharacterized protein n=1 Tax=Gluconacetobacter tumulicola TaxID=1017177 RepID=A0A7W4P599_9PROT|nr:hypothetical protein [Gluconacetobacter tumulicola]MBB2177659.1 hypothetical protein [Gluconacetobacter tumulicola]
MTEAALYRSQGLQNFYASIDIFLLSIVLLFVFLFLWVRSDGDQQFRYLLGEVRAPLRMTGAMG